MLINHVRDSLAESIEPSRNLHLSPVHPHRSTASDRDLEIEATEGGEGLVKHVQTRYGDESVRPLSDLDSREGCNITLPHRTLSNLPPDRRPE